MRQKPPRLKIRYNAFRVKCSLAILGLTIFSCSQDMDKKSIIYSQKVKDSFEIYISTPDNFDHAKSYDVIYYCDANLRSGKKLREMLKKVPFASKVNNTIFVGIGHTGNYQVMRRRDFILPDIVNGDTIARSQNYGQIENFYQFLKMELIPKINSSYKTNPGDNSIIGHSLGGLFVFYCLFKNETLFKNYYALSPSLWINNYSIYKFNHLANGISREKNLYFSAGSHEIFNYVKKGARNMEAFLKSKKYENLKFTYEVHPGETHHSQVGKSFEFILSH